MLTGDSASVLGVPDYTRFTMASGMTDAQIETLYDFLVLGKRSNPKKDRMYLFHIAHRGTAYFGLGPTPRVAKRKLDQQLKGTSVNAESPNVQQYEIDYNAVAGEGWNSKI